MLIVSGRGAGHPDEDVLEQYVMGKLDEPVTEAIENHILLCASCQDRAESTETYIRSMRSALASAPLAQAAEGSWRTRVAEWLQMPAMGWAAAAAVLVLGLGGVVGSRYLGSTGNPVAVALVATRGETASVAAKGPLDLDLDARDLAPAESYRVQMVNSDGKEVWEEGAAHLTNGHVRVRVAKHLGAGQYFVRIYGVNANTPREYAIQIR